MASKNLPQRKRIVLWRLAFATYDEDIKKSDARQIFYKEEDVLALLKELGFETPDREQSKEGLESFDHSEQRMPELQKNIMDRIEKSEKNKK